MPRCRKVTGYSFLCLNERSINSNSCLRETIDDPNVAHIVARMSAYRFYFTTTTNHLTGVPVRLDFADDAAALVQAGEMARTPKHNNAKGIEVWEGRRWVGRVPIDRTKPS